MKYNKKNYIGKEIEFCIEHTYFGIITNVDDFGWMIKIIDIEDYNSDTQYDIRDRIFISHSRPFNFRFLED